MSDSNDYSRGYWYASGRIDQLAPGERAELYDRVGNDAEMTFGVQFETLRDNYLKSKGKTGCPSMKLAWTMFHDTGDAVTEWAKENERWST